MDAPNYSRYSLNELAEARQTIDADAYPERAAKLDSLLASFQDEINQDNEELHRVNRYRTFGPRIGAMIVDSIVLGIGFLIVGALVDFQNSMWLWWLDEVGMIVYPVVLHALYGQTVGKMATEVIVLDAKTETSISFSQAALRDCVPIFSTLLIVVIVLLFQLGVITTVTQWLSTGLIIFTWSLIIWHLLEIITMLTNEKRRALHDFIAGTVVVRK